MKRIIIFSLVLMTLTGCSIIVPSIVPCRIKKEFKYCFNGEYTGLDTLININGYYAPDTIIRQSNYRGDNGTLKVVKDTLSPAYVLYDNGFVFEIGGTDYFIENKKIFKQRILEPGGYILFGDTIKFQYVSAPGGQTRELVEIWFKIIDRNTLQRLPVGTASLQPYTELIYAFRPLEPRVKPEDMWIYNKKWFRCNKK